MPEFEAWFWGHEHSMQLFEPYAGLKRGRLIGNGSTPILQSQNVSAAAGVQLAACALCMLQR